MNILLDDRGNGDFALTGTADYANTRQMLFGGQKRFGLHQVITVNLAEVDCANTPGLALLMEWVTWCQLNNIELTYNDPPQNLVELARVHDIEGVLVFSGLAPD